MKQIYLLLCSMLLLPPVIGQIPDTLFYSMLFTDNHIPGQTLYDMSVVDASLIDNFTGLEKPKKENRVAHVAITSGLLVISGFCDGTSEVLKIKYDRFEKVFPHANDQFWDYNISWKNKYKDGIPPDPAFWGSKTSLVWTTDGYHMMRAFRNAAMITALVIPLQDFRHKSWKHYVQEAIINYFSYTVGFNMAYDVVFK
ncbi:MAG TPA: hypothetical protein VK172_12830 [Lentimicrobium sp.]|nr:hypothetical protein [Lentimicrobium sp.]